MADRLDTQALLDKALETVRMDVNHVFTQVRTRKLGPTEARDLVAYAKLLHDLVQDEREQASDAESDAQKLSDDELVAKAKALIDGEG